MTVTPTPGVFPAIGRYLEDAGLLLVVVVMIPATILLVGAPFALLIRAAIEIVRRF